MMLSDICKATRGAVLFCFLTKKCCLVKGLCVKYSLAQMVLTYSHLLLINYCNSVIFRSRSYFRIVAFWVSGEIMKLQLAAGFVEVAVQTEHREREVWGHQRASQQVGLLWLLICLYIFSYMRFWTRLHSSFLTLLFCRIFSKLLISFV